MNLIFERRARSGFSIIELMLAIMLIAFMVIGAASICSAGTQGDRIWTESDSDFKISTLAAASGTSCAAVAFPYDPNAQPVCYYIDATAQTSGVKVDAFGVSAYYTSGYAVSGATTALHFASAADATAVSAGDLVVVDDGAGLCAWAEITSVSGAIATMTAGVSNFAKRNGDGAIVNTSWAAGARIYVMKKLGSLTVGNATKQVDNSQGIFAAPRNSPLLLVLDETGSVTSGSVINGATVRYERVR